MDNVLAPLLQSPLLPDYVRELTTYLQAEQHKQYELKSKMDNGTVRCAVLQGLEIPFAAIFDEEANEQFLQRL